MINLTLGTNTEKKSVIVDVNTVVREALDQNGVSTQGSALYLNGQMIPGSDLDSSFASLGVADGSKAMLIAVVKSDCAASIKYKDNVLTFVSDITKESVEKGIGEMVVRDEKNKDDIVYFAGFGTNGDVFDGSVNFNTYVDGKAAVVKVLPMDTTQEDVMKMYGEKLLTAKKYTTQMAKEMEAKEAEIAEAFGAETEEAPENDGE